MSCSSQTPDPCSRNHELTDSRTHRARHLADDEYEYATAGWLDWYNNRRLHVTLEMTTPVERENAYYEALDRGPQHP